MPALTPRPPSFGFAQDKLPMLGEGVPRRAGATSPDGVASRRTRKPKLVEPALPAPLSQYWERGRG